MKFFIYITFIFFSFSCSNDSGKETFKAVDTITTKYIPAEEVTGVVKALLPAPSSFNLKEAKKWYDAMGENWLVLYETGSYVGKAGTGASAKLTAILYQKTDSGFFKQWTMHDFIADCELDVVCEFYDQHLSVSDLDSNGIAEIMMVYALSCKGDVSPNSKKLILYEGKNKYAIRGEELMVLKKDTIGGSRKNDASFEQLPQVIKDSALRHWQKFGVTKYE
jgi:hypothetical protein